jgi:hypothetical protein
MRNCVQLSSAENVPPGSSIAFCAIRFFVHHAKIVRRAASALGKRHIVIDLMESRIIFFPCAQLELRDRPTSCSRAHLSFSSRTPEKNQRADDYRNRNRPWLQSGLVRDRNVGNAADDATDRQPAQVVNEIFPPSPNAGDKQGGNDNDDGCLDLWRRHSLQAVAIPPRGMREFTTSALAAAA